MIDALPLLLGPEGYQISRSVRLRSSASAYFQRTITTTGSATTITFSSWVKRGRLGARQTILSNKISTSGINALNIEFSSSDTLAVANGTTADVASTTASTAVFRDPSAWYHIVVAIDTTLASGRVKAWVNNQQVISADPMAQNATLRLSNNSYPHTIGQDPRDATYYDGYLTEINFIDGQALTPASFGETNPVTGVWQPKKYAGTYGTNGFYLNFADNSAATAAAIGADYSGNGNNWTPNNISLTAGVTYDSMLDVPTLWADGGNGRGNYCVWNPVSGLGGTFSNGNLQSATGTSTQPTIGTFQLPISGKWYWEVTVSTVSEMAVGVNIPPFANATKTAYYRQGGASNGIYIEGSTDPYAAASYTNNDVIAVAFDADSSQISWYKNNVQQGGPYTLTSTANLFPYLVQVSGSGSCTGIANFGQRPFAYTPPTGFKALNTLNLPEPTILKGNQYFDAVLWTGDNTNSRTITGVGFQPDLVWAKSRSNAQDNLLLDSVRGGTFNLISNSTAQEFAASAFSGGAIDSTASDGFTVVRGSTNGNNVNQSAFTYVAWNWKEGATQGFDIVTYTGTGANRTVAHGLGDVPAMMICKARAGGVENWYVWHKSISGSTPYIYLNLTNAAVTGDPTRWTAAPTSAVINLGSNTGTNGSGYTYVAYLFAEVAGFSKFGSYTGNGSADGPMIFTGFRPRFVMFKRTDAVEGWYMYDTARDTINAMQNELRADSSAAEAVFSSRDFLSNGFKVRTANGSVNASGGTYIYAAFAETSFKFSLGR